MRKQPNSNDCFVCGVKNPAGLHLNFYETSPGVVTADYTVPDHFQSYPGIVHGGIIAAMLDEVAGRALMGEDPPRFMYTARLQIRYRKKVPIGEPLHLVGKAGISRGHTARAAAQIFDVEGNVLAEAEALMVDVPEEIVNTADLEEMGWKVYPEKVG